MAYEKAYIGQSSNATQCQPPSTNGRPLVPDAKSNIAGWHLPAWDRTAAISLAPARIADEIPRGDHRVGSLRETPMPWTSTWSRSERRRGPEAEDEMAEV